MKSIKSNYLKLMSPPLFSKVENKGEHIYNFNCYECEQFPQSTLVFLGVLRILVAMCLFPLDSSWWLRSHVIQYAVNVVYFVDDTY